MAWNPICFAFLGLPAIVMAPLGRSNLNFPLPCTRAMARKSERPHLTTTLGFLLVGTFDAPITPSESVQ